MLFSEMTHIGLATALLAMTHQTSSRCHLTQDNLKIHGHKRKVLKLSKLLSNHRLPLFNMPSPYLVFHICGSTHLSYSLIGTELQNQSLQIHSSSGLEAAQRVSQTKALLHRWGDWDSEESLCFPSDTPSTTWSRLNGWNSRNGPQVGENRTGKRSTGEQE